MTDLLLHSLEAVVALNSFYIEALLEDVCLFAM